MNVAKQVYMNPVNIKDSIENIKYTGRNVLLKLYALKSLDKYLNEEITLLSAVTFLSNFLSFSGVYHISCSNKWCWKYILRQL